MRNGRAATGGLNTPLPVTHPRGRMSRRCVEGPISRPTTGVGRATGEARAGCHLGVTYLPSIASAAAQSRGIPPLFKADCVNLAVSASKDGKLRVVYGGWDDAKVIPGGASTDPAWRPQHKQRHARTDASRQKASCRALLRYADCTCGSAAGQLWRI
jgi:hypothetical protein